MDEQDQVLLLAIGRIPEEVRKLQPDWKIVLMRSRFNAIAFYLDIADMLAKEGL